ncbi:MAG: hypothetical protein HPY71_07195 [Firmicutes bacterium]|nr:hypothetical protein [Bacillota bacterium]
MTGISGWWFRFTTGGDVLGTPDMEAYEFARSRGLRVMGTFHNFLEGRFIREIAHAILTDPAAKRRAIDSAIAAARQFKLDGIHIDLENVDPNDRQALTSFMRELYMTSGPYRILVTQAVPGKTEEDPRHPWSGGFDYAVLSRYTDWLVILAYEEHSFTGPPGPLASYNWYRTVMNFALSQVPLRKLFMAIGVYGYDWPLAPIEPAATVTFEDVMRISETYNAPLVVDPVSRECTLVYLAPGADSGRWHVVWYQCFESVEWKLALVREHSIPGVAIWELGQEDPRIWTLIPPRGA